MSVDLIVIVENSNNVTLEAFKHGMLQDQVAGEFAWLRYADNNDPDFTPWEEFIWKDKRYFTWLYTPRNSTVNLYDFDEEEDEPDEYDITFFKVMLRVEELAGGAVYVGNDILNKYCPSEGLGDEDDEDDFWLPFNLDSLRGNWRETAKLEAKPVMIF